MKIREATKDDTIKLKKLINIIGYDKKIAEKRATNWANNKTKIMLVIEHENQLIGYLGIKQMDEGDEEIAKIINLNENAVLNWTGIDPHFRHKGFGSILVNSCDEIVRSWGKKGIWLCCKEKVIPFYQFNNYEIAGCYEYKEKPRFVMLKILR